MNQRYESHLFWGKFSPLTSLMGLGLIVLASGRFAFALICTGALIWVYLFTAVVYSNARKLMPEKGRKIILLFLSTFLCGILMFLFSLINPLMVLGSWFFLILIPPACLGSALFDDAENIAPAIIIKRAFLEALVLSGIILAIALIREPLGMGTLSFPGGISGIIEVTSDTGSRTVPFRLFSISSGAILLLGYGAAIFSYLKVKIHGSSGDGR